MKLRRFRNEDAEEGSALIARTSFFRSFRDCVTVPDEEQLLRLEKFN